MGFAETIQHFNVELKGVSWGCCIWDIGMGWLTDYTGWRYVLRPLEVRSLPFKTLSSGYVATMSVAVRYGTAKQVEPSRFGACKSRVWKA